MKKPYIFISGVQSYDDLPYDPRCPIAKGSRVEKVLDIEPDEVHSVGARGYTIGGFWQDDIKDAYIIKWDNGIPTACIGAKIKQIKEHG